MDELFLKALKRSNCTIQDVMDTFVNSTREAEIMNLVLELTDTSGDTQIQHIMDEIHADDLFDGMTSREIDNMIIYCMNQLKARCVENINKMQTV